MFSRISLVALPLKDSLKLTSSKLAAVPFNFVNLYLFHFDQHLLHSNCPVIATCVQLNIHQFNIVIYNASCTQVKSTKMVHCRFIEVLLCLEHYLRICQQNTA